MITPSAEPAAIDNPLRIRNLPLTVLAVVAIVAAMRLAQDALLPVVVSVLIAYALNPFVAALTKLRLGRTAATALVMAAILGGTVTAGYYLSTPAADVLNDLPDAARKLHRLIERSRVGTGPMDKVNEAASEIERTATEAVGDSRSPANVPSVRLAGPARMSEYLWSGSVSVLTFVGQSVVVFFLVYFLLASGDLYKRKLVTLVGSTFSEKRVTVQILNEIEMQIGRFLAVQLFTGTIVAVATSAVLWWFGVNQPLVWGVTAGVLNSIPYFGAIAVSTGLALVAFLQFGTVSQALYVSGAALIITSLEGYLLTPILLGRASRINQIALFIAILFWSWMWGVAGMILAVPIMMAIKSVCDRVEGLSPIAEMLGEKTRDA